MNAKVSVVIPVYNGMPYLPRAIEGALNQSHPVHEIIVVDDESTDDTPKILNAYGDRVRSRRIAHAGVAQAMNSGVEMATGDWVAFLDHDDVWFKNKLRAQIEALSKFPSAGFSCSNYALRPVGLGRRLTRHFSKLKSLKESDLDPPLLTRPYLRLITENFVGTSSAVLARMDVVRKIGKFDTGYRICGDYDYWLRCSLVTDFVILPQMLFYKQTHATNISANSVQTMVEYRDVLRGFMLSNRDFFEKQRLLPLYASAMADVNYLIGTLCFESGKTKQAFGFYWQALQSRKNPSNAAIFLFTALKKALRTLTSNRMSRKNIDRFLPKHRS